MTRNRWGTVWDLPIYTYSVGTSLGFISLRPSSSIYYREVRKTGQAEIATLCHGPGPGRELHFPPSLLTSTTNPTHPSFHPRHHVS